MFQTTHRLAATGELDDHTVLELEQRHDKLHSQPTAGVQSAAAGNGRRGRSSRRDRL